MQEASATMAEEEECESNLDDDGYDDDEKEAVSEDALAETAAVTVDHRNQLFESIRRGDAHGVQQAIKCGADVNSVGRNNDAPLKYACQYGTIEIVRILLDAGANARWRNIIGQSAMLAACYVAHLPTIEMLHNHDNNLLEIADISGVTPLCIGTIWGSTDVVRFLIDSGANVHATHVCM